MTRYSKVSFWAVLFGLLTFPCYASAASITETSSAIGEGCIASGTWSTAMGYYTTASASSSTVIGNGLSNDYRLINDRNQSFMVGYMVDPNDTDPEFFVKNGAVGFGTSTPTEQITITTPSNNDTKILFTEDTAPAVSLFYEGSAGSGTSNKFHLRSEISGSESNIMTWKLNGYVGIGKTSPGQRLDIAGGNGRVETGYNWLTNSDVRLKRNIVDLNNSLEKVSRLRGVRFDSIKKDSVQKNGVKHIGVIAQELEKEYPELVVGDEKTGYKAVAYDKLTAVLIEAVKELKAQNEIQRIKNEKQQAEIEELRLMIKELNG